MQRIKYYKRSNVLEAEIYDIYAKRVLVRIYTRYEEILGKYYFISIGSQYRNTQLETSSLQNAKRKVRKILKEEFEVNLQDEVRSKLCI